MVINCDHAQEEQSALGQFGLSIILARGDLLIHRSPAAVAIRISKSRDPGQTHFFWLGRYKKLAALATKQPL
jgi:hypothetical protein